MTTLWTCGSRQHMLFCNMSPSSIGICGSVVTSWRRTTIQASARGVIHSDALWSKLGRPHIAPSQMNALRSGDSRLNESNVQVWITLDISSTSLRGKNIRWGETAQACNHSALNMAWHNLCQKAWLQHSYFSFLVFHDGNSWGRLQNLNCIFLEL